MMKSAAVAVLTCGTSKSCGASFPPPALLMKRPRWARSNRTETPQMRNWKIDTAPTPRPPPHREQPHHAVRRGNAHRVEHLALIEHLRDAGPDRTRGAIHDDDALDAGPASEQRGQQEHGAEKHRAEQGHHPEPLAANPLHELAPHHGPDLMHRAAPRPAPRSARPGR